MLPMCHHITTRWILTSHFSHPSSPSPRPYSWRGLATQLHSHVPPPPTKGQNYSLTLVCSFSGWIEAFLTTTENSATVTKVLLEEITPIFLPYYSPVHFRLTMVPLSFQQVESALNISWKLHIPHHPQSSGKVDRADFLPKSQLTKLSLELKQP